jgi:hypothetical protein
LNRASVIESMPQVAVVDTVTDEVEVLTT